MQCLECGYDLNADNELCQKCGKNLNNQRKGHLKPGAMLSARYKITESLGQGAFGITYKAFDNQLEREVAIKEFFPIWLVKRDNHSNDNSVNIMFDDEFSKELERFFNEGKTIARLEQINLIRIHDIFKENNTAYLVNSLLKGVTLSKDIKNHSNNSDVQKVARICKGLVDALDYIHQNKIYHLDIKPLNIMITEDERPVLFDFGLARMLSHLEGSQDSSLTMTHYTPAYAPPEIRNGKIKSSELGPWVDIFELGMTIYEMLTGKLPTNAALRSEHDSLSAELSILGEPWKSMLLEALLMNPKIRPNNVKEWWENYFVKDKAKYFVVNSEKIYNDDIIVNTIKKQIASGVNTLDLSVYHNIPLEAGTEIGKFRGVELLLNGLTSMSDKLAEKISSWPTNEDNSAELHLNGLPILSDKLAEILSSWKGKYLFLNGLTNLSTSAAYYLSDWNGLRIELGGLAKIPQFIAYQMSLWKVKEIYLNNLSELSGDCAKYLSNWKGNKYCFKKISKKSISKSAFQYLSDWVFKEANVQKIILFNDFELKNTTNRNKQ